MSQTTITPQKRGTCTAKYEESCSTTFEFSFDVSKKYEVETDISIDKPDDEYTKDTSSTTLIRYDENRLVVVINVEKKGWIHVSVKDEKNNYGLTAFTDWDNRKDIKGRNIDLSCRYVVDGSDFDDDEYEPYTAQLDNLYATTK